ncbi:hypothetical protein EIJ81_20700 [Aliivibrio salmonicida]|uniref:hypothetical protein n=1 Tax=Aliivibrio salmonicida TaxID=40269 RepID=UPI0002E09A17|nr:hypothetical protein [Aliivibrio salmonicida]AZL86740.1 hypothetical protein EIJ81_20685 [Aliivibrio salmonicida]AZL86743.1 hypothetical protein EIJ81_20700 [Aliivibrio salmonicida]
MEKVFYEVMPDWTVSVFVCGEWDFFKTYQNLVSYCESNFYSYELIDVEGVTHTERQTLIGGSF